ncbi:HAD family hydrolase [Thiosulfativibrio zosterae]|uniref:Phosphoserine phosphatase n=1 Tax=Thiosulfativibrio zosterae TaxID=2675053 RepID=A0A6F8PMB6_9GAMM|nr:HAD family hydrolase [Thiosulfativibrio zosterae]BBP43235.1 phosphoserine phosphatase [Thiosulfativibrio zosterae]
MKLAIFDLDNTLIAGDSDYLWGKFLIQKGAVDPAFFEAENDRFYANYKNGTLNIMEYQRFSLKPLTQYPMQTLLDWHQEFMQTMIEPIYLQKAQDLVNQHKANGDTLLIITATNSFVTRPIGLRYGIDHLIGTDPEIINHCFTGEVSGTPSFQDGKVIRLNDWLEEHPFDLKDAYFYSDSRNDLPLLEAVGNPTVVDGDDVLKTIAKERNWPSISLRN